MTQNTTLRKPSHENLYDAAKSEQPREQIDAELKWQPEGGLVIDARVADGNGQDIVEVRIDKDGKKEATIDDQQMNEEQIEMLGTVLGINLSGDVNPNDIEVRDDSPLQESLERQ